MGSGVGMAIGKSAGTGSGMGEGVGTRVGVAVAVGMGVAVDKGVVVGTGVGVAAPGKGISGATAAESGPGSATPAVVVSAPVGESGEPARAAGVGAVDMTAGAGAACCVPRVSKVRSPPVSENTQARSKPTAAAGILTRQFNAAWRKNR